MAFSKKAGARLVPSRRDRAAARAGDGASVEALLALAADELARLSQVATEVGERVSAGLERLESGGGAGGSPSERDQIAAQLGRTVTDSVQDLATEAHDLEDVLRKAVARLGGSEAGEDPAAPPLERAERPVAPGREVTEISAGVQLLITQMAHAGEPAGEIATLLRRDFGVDNAEQVIDRVLGADETAQRSRAGSNPAKASQAGALAQAGGSTASGAAAPAGKQQAGGREDTDASKARLRDKRRTKRRASRSAEGEQSPPEARSTSDAARAGHGEPESAERAREPDEAQLPERARILVVQMITAGSTREEIIARLESEFSLPEPEAAVATLINESASGR